MILYGDLNNILEKECIGQFQQKITKWTISKFGPKNLVDNKSWFYLSTWIIGINRTFDLLNDNGSTTLGLHFGDSEVQDTGISNLFL